MELILDHWYQISIVLVAGAIAFSIVAKAGDSVFTYLKELLNMIIGELRSSIASRRAGIVNVTMLFISGVLAIIISIPSVFSQIGFPSDNKYYALIPGPILFISICFISSHYCLSVEKLYPAFKDKDNRAGTQTNKEQTKSNIPS